MSKGSKKVEKYLDLAFPTYRVIKEKYIKFNETDLLFDFYLPELKLIIEVQGNQHFTFNKFFHTDVSDFNKQQFRDNLKKEWANENNIRLLEITSNEIENLSIEEFTAKVIETI